MSEVNKKRTRKIYCDVCDSLFDSSETFDNHLDSHKGSPGGCEPCPIDVAISKFFSFFKKK